MHGRCIEAATRYSLQLIAVAAVAAAVGVSLNGQPFPGACLAVLVALMTAPASTVDDGLLAGVLQIAAVYLASPTIELEPAPTARWTFIGGLVLVPLMARSSKPGPLKGISAPTAYRHWVAMAVALAILPLSLLNTAYSLLGRYGQAVAFLTPGAVLGATLRLAGRRGVGDDPTPLWGRHRANGLR